MLESPPPEPNRDPAQIMPIIRYVGILASKYPKPLSNKSLADYARVSEPAVSKLKDRIFSICDDKWLGHRRRLILRTDNQTASQIFAGFFFAGKLSPLLKTAYGRRMIDKWARDFYHNVAKGAPDIRAFFSEDDFSFLADFIASALAKSMRRLDFGSIFDAQHELGVQYALVGLVYTVWTKIGPCLQRCVKNEATLHRLLTIRDKTWFMLQEGIRRRTETVLKDFLITLPDDQARDAYLSVYMETAAFYLERAISEYVTRPLRDSATKRRIRFDEEFVKLGYFYTPSVSLRETFQRKIELHA